jgi:hypothetical protein
MAVTTGSGPDKTAVELVVQWLITTTDDVGGRPLVYAPNRPSIRKWPILAAFRSERLRFRAAWAWLSGFFLPVASLPATPSPRSQMSFMITFGFASTR